MAENNTSNDDFIDLNLTGSQIETAVAKASTIPVGGTTNQVLKKSSNSNYSAEWASVVNSVNGQTGDVSIPVDQTYNSSSSNAQSGTAVAGAIATVHQIPDGGLLGQVLKKTSNSDYAVGWADDNTGGGGGGTVDQTYNSSSSNAQSGTAVAGAIATVHQIPATTGHSNSDVLQINNGSAVWNTVDTTVTQNSNNLITSGAVYSVIGNIESQLHDLRGNISS